MDGPERIINSFSTVFAVGLDARIFQRSPWGETDPRAQERRAIVQGTDRTRQGGFRIAAGGRAVTVTGDLAVLDQAAFKGGNVVN